MLRLGEVYRAGRQGGRDREAAVANAIEELAAAWRVPREFDHRRWGDLVTVLVEMAEDAGTDEPAAAQSVRCKAVQALLPWAAYDTGEGSDHWSSEDSLAMDAAELLERLAGKEPELLCDIGLEGLQSPWTDVTTWGVEMLVRSGLPRAEEALKELVEAASTDRARDAARKALSDLAGGSRAV